MRSTAGIQSRTKRLCGLRTVQLRLNRIRMNREKIQKGCNAGTEKMLSVPGVPSADTGSDAGGGIFLADPHARQADKTRIFLRIRIPRLPEGRQIGLIPDFIKTDPSAEMTGKRRNIVLPCADRLLPVVQGNTTDSRLAVRLFHIQRIPESHIEPALNAFGQKFVHNLIEPGEIIGPALLFAAVPAGLAAGPLDPCPTQFPVTGFRIKKFAVQTFKTDAHTGARRQFPRRAAFQFPAIFQFDSFHPGKVLFQDFILHIPAPSLSSVSCLCFLLCFFIGPPPTSCPFFQRAPLCMLCIQITIAPGGWRKPRLHSGKITLSYDS